MLVAVVKDAIFALAVYCDISVFFVSSWQAQTMKKAFARLKHFRFKYCQHCIETRFFLHQMIGIHFHPSYNEYFLKILASISFTSSCYA